MRKVLSGPWFSGILISIISSVIVYWITWAMNANRLSSWLIAGIAFVAAFVIAYFIDRKQTMSTNKQVSESTQGAFIHISNSRGGKVSNNSVPRGMPLAKVEDSEDIDFDGNIQRD